MHLFQITLDQDESTIRSMKSLLQDDELCEADRFEFSRDRNRYISARAALRGILAKMADCAVQAIRIARTPAGKPFIRGFPWQFNLTHSHDHAVVALARKPVGVDLEYHESDHPRAAIIRKFFSPEERAILERAPSSQMRRWFYTIWTVREAYVKATGEGMKGLEHIRTTWNDGPNPRIHRQGSPSETGRWNFHRFELEGGYVGACCYESA